MLHTCESVCSFPLQVGCKTAGTAEPGRNEEREGYPYQDGACVAVPHRSTGVRRLDEIGLFLSGTGCRTGREESIITVPGAEFSGEDVRKP